MKETSQIDKKSLRKITKRNPDWDEIAKDCVCFANGYGGKILFGIEDGDDLPPEGQKIPNDLLPVLVKNIQGRTINVSVIPKVIQTENNAEYLELTIQRTASTVACTSSGKYYMRVEDDCKPVMPDELTRLISDKSAFVWELQSYLKVPKTVYDPEKLRDFVIDVRKSTRVSPFVKEKSPEELMDYYFFSQGDYLTNLGVLWIGKRVHRAKLLYAPAVQYIKYDEQENKVNKLVWDDYSLNPKELIEDVWEKVPDWKESLEIEDGLFRRNVAIFDEVVVRELLANALAHRPYTIRGDLFINIYPDRMEIHNPGSFPLGVTPENILHKSVQRNTHLSKVFYDLQLMEKEGSGYDRMYEVLLTQGKPLLTPIEAGDRVTVIVKKRIVNKHIIQFIEKVNQEYQLTTKELISLGLIAQHNALTAFEYGKMLGLSSQEAVQSWIGRLVDFGLVKTKGKTKGTTYFADPELLKKANFKGRTTLRKIAPHRLKHLILEDLERYGESSIGDIHQRIGKEIPIRRLRYELNLLSGEEKVVARGEKRWRTYAIDKKP